MTPEAAFFKAWGREPTRLERERIRRLQSAFAIEENDALLTIAMVLEFYDGVFRLYPGKCADAAAEAVKEWLASPQGHAVLLHPTPTLNLSEERSLPPLPTTAHQHLPIDNRRELYWVVLGGLATASNAISGALGMFVGSSCSGNRPGWLGGDAGRAVAVHLLTAPMGWVVFLALLVPAYYWARWGWHRGRDANRTLTERGLGWAAFAATAGWPIAWALLVGQLMGT